jgi:NAD+ diphosphatase
VSIILASRPNAYTGSPLDRVSQKRDDPAFIQAALAAPTTLFAPVWRARNLMRGAEDGHAAAVFLDQPAAAPFRAVAGAWSLLGLDGETAVFAVDVSALEDASAGDASVLAYARGLMHWRGKHRFCGVCGAQCTAERGGHVMACASCGTQHFPRTDPAVIMLVTNGDRALLGHSNRFPNSKMYSTLAGFVEPGESLEEAVAREVLEESGVRVGRVTYHSSQPWPFPASIMLGFYAEALSEAISLTDDELLDAKWFTLAELRDPAAHGFALPRLDSIARRLIEDWMAQA